MQGVLRIGEVARRAGVSVDLVRYYERVGLMPAAPRTDGGYRCYTEDAVRQLLFVRNALRFGFSAREIAGFVKARQDGRPPCRSVRAAGQRILETIDQQIADLRTTRSLMAHTLAAWDERLARTRSDEPAHLLAMIPAVGEKRPRRPDLNRRRSKGRA